ncbi:MAG TPA: glycosyltransferase family 4 protein [Dehalococcoidia bacterium]|nr:glycosyltransferase family 4 protein [Dehalococcoidia bacterium]
MRLLFLTPLFPYPPESGGAIKTWTLLEFLRDRCRLDVLCFHRSELTAEQRDYAEMFPGSLLALTLDRQRDARNLLRSYASGVPLSVYRNASPQMTEFVGRQLASTQYDAIFIDHWLMAQYLPEHFGGLRLLHLHNAESVVWRRQVQFERSAWRRWLLRLEAFRVRRYERSLLARFDHVFAVSEADRQELRELRRDAPPLDVLPNVPDPRLLAQPPLEPADLPKDVLYLGTLSWQPNLQGLSTFLEEAFPSFPLALPGSRLIIAGSGAPPRLRQLAGAYREIEMVSPAPDAESLYRRSRAFLEPVRGGGGTKLKVLNAMARGLPVVATLDGAQGIEAVSGEHLLVGQGPQELLGGLQRLMTDDALWQRLSENGRRLVAERYRPEQAFGPLAAVLAGER